MCGCTPTVASTSAPRGSWAHRSPGSRGPASSRRLRPEELTERRWFDVWQGGLVTTCGLSNVGATSEGWGLHGTYTSRAASDLTTERTDSSVVVTGTIIDAPFTLERRVSHRGRCRSAPCRGSRHEHERVDGRGTHALSRECRRAALGHRRLPRDRRRAGRAERRGRCRRPRDVGRAAGPGRRRRRARVRAHRRDVGTADQCWYRDRADDPIVDAAHVAVGAPGERIYALGIEPANCSVLGRAFDIAAGRMPLLDPGETRESWLTLDVRSTRS